MVTLVDIEAHWLPAPVDAALRALPASRRDDSLVLNEHGDAGTRLADLGAGRLAAMDEQAVAVQVLSVVPPGTQALDAAAAVPLAREANDRAAEAVAAHPDRLRALATLPLPDPAAAAAELERSAGLGLVGALVFARSGDLPLDDRRNDDVFAVAEALELPLFLHPSLPPRAVRDATYAGIGEAADLALSTYAWGWHLDAGTAALRLMATGALDRFPRLRLVLGHWGEMLLFWRGRADALARAAGLQRSVTEYLQQNTWITASGMLDPVLLRHALEVTTTDRILFSTDHPFQRPSREQIAEFLAALPDDAAREGFAGGNARSLFGLGPGTGPGAASPSTGR